MRGRTLGLGLLLERIVRPVLPDLVPEKGSREDSHREEKPNPDVGQFFCAH